MKAIKLDVKRGLDRLARVYCWPNDPIISGEDKVLFDALCEFVLFKEFVKTPFFNSLLGFLYEHIADFYQYLYNNQSDKTPLLSYKEAYHFMRDYLEVENVKLMLDHKSCPSNIYNKILRSLEEDRFDDFFSALDTSDHAKMMKVLWEMRYIMSGEKKSLDAAFNPLMPHIDTLPYLSRWIKRNDRYFRVFFKFYDDEEEFIMNRVESIVGVRLTQNKISHLIRPSIHRPKDNYGENNKTELKSFFEASLFKSHWKPLLQEFTDNSQYLPVFISAEEDAKIVLTHNIFFQRRNIMAKYGKEASNMDDNYHESLDYFCFDDTDYTGYTREFGAYILYYTREMLSVYYKVEAILSDEIKEELNNLLNYLFYSELLKPKLPYNNEVGEKTTLKELSSDDSTTDDKESNSKQLLNKWKENLDPHKKIKTFKPITKLKDEEIIKLTKGLAETKDNKGAFIEKDTNHERLAHILCGNAFDGTTPIIWIKKMKKNQKPNKKSVLNFLRLLGVDWRDITPKSLNACFICSNADDYNEFDHNNINKESKWSESECHEELKTIIRAALGDKHIICRLWSDNPTE